MLEDFTVPTGFAFQAAFNNHYEKLLGAIENYKISLASQLPFFMFTFN